MKNKYEFKLNPEEVNDSHMGLARRIKPGERILELGCSSGYLSRFLQQDLGCTVIGVDIDQKALSEAARFCKKAIVADLDQQSWFKDIHGEVFDTILCADVLEHLKNPATLLSNLKSYLSPQGRILASIPNIAHASVRLELLQGHFDYESLGILDDTHLHFYTLNGCVSMMMQAGFLCKDVEYSIHDIADEVIDQSLTKLGLKVSEQFRQQLHKPEAAAFQFIIEALPARAELLRHKPPSLTPKPLVSSGAFYSIKQEVIDGLEKRVTILERERDALIVTKDAAIFHNQNHLKNIQALEEKMVALELAREAERTHELNHLQHIRELEKSLLAVERERDAEKLHNKNHELNINALNQKVVALEDQVLILQQDRNAEKVHNQNHIKNIRAFEAKVTALEQERDAEKTHNSNHQKNIAAWVKTGRVLDEHLFELTLRLDVLTTEKQQMLAHVDHLQANFNHLLAEKERQIAVLNEHTSVLREDCDRLEAVLSRVHNKISYRAVRLLKEAPGKLTSPFKSRQPEFFLENDVVHDGSNPQDVCVDNYNVHDYSAWLDRYGDSSANFAGYRDDFHSWSNPPKIAIVMPVFNPSEACLEAAISSVMGQIYPYWELCIADDASTEIHVQTLLNQCIAQDDRIKMVHRQENGHISRASNSALELVTADFVALMDHDDVLTPDALYWVAKTVFENPDVQLIYSDEDKLTDEGHRYGAYF